MRARTEVRFAVGLAFGLALCTADLSHAQVEREPLPVSFDVQIVHGLKRAVPAQNDPECTELKKRLPMHFGSLKMIQHKSLQLAFGQSGQMVLPTGRFFRLMPISVLHERLHLQFELQDLVNTRLQMVSGRPVILGGEPHADGQLIIMVTPEFRHLLRPQPSPGRPAPSGQQGPRLHRVNAER